jgi:hypothetical protein
MFGFEQVQKRQGQSSARRFCDEHYLSLTTMLFLQELTGQIFSIMREARVTVNHPYALRHDANSALVIAVVGTGLYPDIGVRKKGAKIFTTEKVRDPVLGRHSYNI